MTPRKKTKATNVYDLLRQDILNGQILAGERLQIEILKNRYQVGATPLREALSRLVANGLVQIEEQCGFKVAPISLEELYDLYQVRIDIEAKALALSLQNGGDEWEAEVVASWYKYKKYLLQDQENNFEVAIWDELQKNFQYSLIKACNSPWLIKIRNSLQDQAARYRFVCLNTHYKNKKTLARFIKANDELVSAALKRDYKKAYELCHANWQDSVNIIAAVMKEKKELI